MKEGEARRKKKQRNVGCIKQHISLHIKINRFKLNILAGKHRGDLNIEETILK
jgi:hypothetical protein